MKRYDFDSVLDDAKIFIRERGIGNQDHPVIVDLKQQSNILLHLLNHVHDLNGKCVKNRGMTFCDN